MHTHCILEHLKQLLWTVLRVIKSTTLPLSLMFLGSGGARKLGCGYMALGAAKKE